VDGGVYRAAARGDALSPATERKQGSRRGAEEEEEGKRSRDPFAKVKYFRDPEVN
jgi:hypothetical protein